METIQDKNQHSPAALITGGSRGLGFALAGALLERGWRVIIDARDEGALRQAARELGEKGQLLAIAGDVCDRDHQRELLRAAERFGGLQLVVNNAGALGPSPLPALLELEPEALQQLFAVNTSAPLALLQTLRPQLGQNTQIINISSDAAREAYPGWGAYGASKAALEQLSAVLAAEQPGWRVYSVDPGDMRTQMHQDAFPGEDISDRPDPSASLPGLLQLIESPLPSGRYQARDMPRPLAAAAK